MSSARRLSWVPAILLLSGCAGMSPAHMGQTVGTIAGSAVAPGVGTPIGALVGLLAGLVLQGEVDKVTEKRERQELGERLTTRTSATPADSAPIQSALAAGEPTRVWVDETVKDGRLIEGHFEVRSTL